MRKKIDWHAPYLIPELLYFQNGCTFTGSVSNEGEKEFRYRLSPAEKTDDAAEGDAPKQIIVGEVWFGPFCYEKSTAEDRHEASMDEAGREDSIDWLAQKYEEMIPAQAV